MVVLVVMLVLLELLPVVEEVFMVAVVREPEVLVLVLEEMEQSESSGVLIGLSHPQIPLTCKRINTLINVNKK
jgi:hypothetical protein